MHTTIIGYILYVFSLSLSGSYTWNFVVYTLGHLGRASSSGVILTRPVSESDIFRHVSDTSRSAAVRGARYMYIGIYARQKRYPVSLAAIYIYTYIG